MKTFYQIIYLSSNAPWSGQDAEPESFSQVEQSVKQAIQMAHSFIWNSFEFDFKVKKSVIPTIATVKAYDKPIGQILNVWLKTSTSYLTLITDFDFLESIVGTPTAYYLEDGKINLYPIPDNVTDLNVRHQTLNMAKDLLGNEKYNLELEEDTLNIPQELEDLYLQALIALAIVYFLQDSTDENYAPYQVTFEKHYQNSMREVRQSSRDTRIVI
jgi:hypothetical protein